MDSTALVLCLFALLCHAQGDIREKTLYRETGTDLLLDVGEPVTLKENDEMFWKFNSKVNVVRLTDTNEIVHQNYTGRAVLSQNQSLLLKNVQKTDSGEYRAEFSGNKDRVLVKYQVTVLDPVSDVKLEVKQCGSNWPDLALTCTTLDDLSSTFICNKTTCSHEGGEPTLKVYLKSGSVTCNHSNQVSSKEDTKTIEELCRKDAVYPVLIATIVVIIVAACVAAALLFRHRRKKKRLILDDVVSNFKPNKDGTDGGETTETTRLKLIHGNESLELEQTNDAQGELPNTTNSMTGSRSAAPTKPSGESDGEETTGPTDLEDSEGDPLQVPGIVVSQSDSPNSIYSMGTLTVDPIQPSGEAKRIMIQMQKDLHKLLQPIHENQSLELEPTNDAQGDHPNTSYSKTGTRSAAPIKPSGESEGEETTAPTDLEPLHENEPLEPGPSNGAQGHMGLESWHFWTGEDVVLYFKKPVVLKKADVELKVKVWQRSASQINRPMGQETSPRSIRYIIRKASNQSWKNKENLTEK